MKVGEERIHDRDVGTAAQSNPAVRFVLRRTVQPHAIKYKMIHWAAVLQRNQVINHISRAGPGDFQSQKAHMVDARRKLDRLASDAFKDNFCHYILSGRAGKAWSSGKRCNSGKAWRDARALRWQRVVGSTGADDDPMSVIAVFGWDDEVSRKCCASLQSDGLATLC